MRTVLGVGVAVACGACGGPAAATAPQPPPVAPCDVRTSVLAAEMSPEDRLEMGLRGDGILSVQLHGCHVRLVPACKGSGKYVYAASNPKDETVRAPELDPVVATSRDVTLRMATVGTFAMEGSAGRPDATSAACARATHVITAFTAGAFDLSASQSAQGLGGATASRNESRKDGDLAACSGARVSDVAPPPSCAAAVRLTLAPIRP